MEAALLFSGGGLQQSAVKKKGELGRQTGLPWLNAPTKPPGYSLTVFFLQTKSDIIYFYSSVSDIENVLVLPQKVKPFLKSCKKKYFYCVQL